MNNDVNEEVFSILNDWLSSCKRNGKISRNTIAVGIVVLDHLRHCGVVDPEDVISSGGEIKGSRAGLGDLLESYGVSASYLKEVTTRQAPQDGRRLFEALGWGEKLADLSQSERDAVLLAMIELLEREAERWLQRQNLKLDIDRSATPVAWLKLILEQAEGRSGGIVEQHVVGAKLQKRHRTLEIANYPAHAADRQTERPGDFSVDKTVYHVTAAPGEAIIEKCQRNAVMGYHPILLVPRNKFERATVLAELKDADKQISIFAIEDFVAMNIIELAGEEKVDYFRVLQEIVEIYNERLSQVETDLSLLIEVR